jgi:hypothetical protein
VVSFDEVAAWAASLRAERLPSEVRLAAARERESVRATIALTQATGAGRRWARATPPGPERDGGLSALFEWDDYGFLAHPGHSAAVIAGGHEEAHVAAAELALRLGAACLLAPIGDQGRTFVHAPAAALAAGIRGGLDERGLARALGLAFLAPCAPTWGGLVATEAKPARIAGPIASGMRAAALAADGVAAPPRALADGLARASFAPLPEFLTGLGERWFLPTLSFKPRPGCSYLQAALAALVDLRPLEREAVASIEVAVGAATLAMEELTRRERAPATEPAATLFSVERSVRVALAYGDVTPETLARPLPAGPTVTLRHEPAFTRDTIASIERGVPLSRGLLRLSPVDWLNLVAGAWKSYPRPLRLAALAATPLRTLGREWRPEALELVFPARVHVRLRDGRELVAERRRHPGQAGAPAAEVEAIIAAKAPNAYQAVA